MCSAAHAAVAMQLMGLPKLIVPGMPYATCDHLYADHCAFCAAHKLLVRDSVLEFIAGITSGRQLSYMLR